GLFNRRFAGEFFRNLEKSGKDGWCVGMMDIDDFKLVNDLYGHSAGDAVLILIADTMRETLRKTDVLIRWGGEEFLLLLADVHPETAVTILDKLRETISSTKIIADGKAISVTVTIGVARLACRDIHASIGISDEMLYEGKKRGKNMVFSMSCGARAEQETNP
ncbi:MAG: GGDEF domain-containing protein, partial [Oscillospiraceae bacterium]|nr:GGDEF domain-containing protein [Oscillospiraceae bacterium]